MVNRLIDWATIPAPRAVALSGLAALGVLGAAFFFQHVLGYQPCILCIYQRIPYAVIIGLAPLALYLWRRDPARLAPILGIFALVTVIGAGIAFFHVGVEHHWWAGTSSCGGGGGGASLEDLRAQIMAAPVVRCDEPQWSLFGITMAGYNVALSLGLAAHALIALKRARR